MSPDEFANAAKETVGLGAKGLKFNPWGRRPGIDFYRLENSVLNTGVDAVAAVREAAEETSLKVRLIEQFHVYSDPQRDPRQHTLTTVFIAPASGTPRGADDAVEARVFEENTLPSVLAFDHEQILRDYFMYKRMGKRPEPIVGAR